MYGIETLVKEHENILRFNELLRNICSKIVEGAEVDTVLMRECVDFGRNYADKQHHGKEEKILFKIMLEELGEGAEKLIRNGMLVEHDLGRFYLSEIESAINRFEQSSAAEDKMDIIANAISYGGLLKRHIEKEDSVAYTFAERMLDNKSKKEVDRLTEKAESDHNNIEIKNRFIGWLEEKSGS